MLTSLLIKALRPVLLPLIIEALEQHAPYTNGPNNQAQPAPRQNPMPSSPPPGFAIYER